MNYIQAFEVVCDEIDFYYQHSYNPAYFEFKERKSYKLMSICVKAFLDKLDDYRFNKYVPYDFLRHDLEQESQMPAAIKKMCCAIRILNLMILLPELHQATVRGLNIDISPGVLYKLHAELPKNFNMLREYLNELLVKFHPSISSYEDGLAVTVMRKNMTSPIVLRSSTASIGDRKASVTIDFVRSDSDLLQIQLSQPPVHVDYEDVTLGYDDVVGEPSCCFSCCFFSKREKRQEKEPLAAKRSNKYN